MTTEIIISQLLGLLGLLSGIKAYSQTDDDKLIKWVVICNSIFIPHYLILEAYSSAFVLFILIVRMLVLTKHKSNLAMSFFMAIPLLHFLAYGEPVEILSVIAMALTTYGYFKLNTVQLRWMLLLSSLLWLSVAFYFNTLFGIVFNALMAAFTIRAILTLTHHQRYHNNKKA